MKIYCMPLGPVEANCYLIVDEKNGVSAVIDPGDYTPELKALLESEEAGTLKHILLTHGHYDHILGVYDLKSDFPDAKITIHPYDSACLICEEISFANHIEKGLQKYIDYDELVEDGSVVDVGDIKLRVMHTPGHTLGGVCYIEENERVMFTGDTLFCRTVGRTDLPGGDWDTLVESLKKLGNLDGDYTVYTGHNRSTTLTTEREKNRYMRKLFKQNTEGLNG
ncbi:MAG: MBL fold metallo-hydrolase [Clostridia bacterium]|nr:MBL fold metallo-hydrolase [Clostridia bacterium]